VSVLCPQAVRTNIVANSPSYQRGSEEAGLGVAAADGILEADAVAALCLEAIAAERFLVLPHQEVASYVERKADDIDRWLAGMRRFQDKLYGEGPLPGDAMAPR
jgi:hypothetical protein